MQESYEYLKKVTNDFKPTVGVICGSGLSGLVNCLEKPQYVNYEDIPNFPRTTVKGHHGELVFGFVGKVKVVLMRGRFHSYEGHDMKVVTMPVKLMKQMGVETLVVTNAAGGINRTFNLADIMIISDHIGVPLMAGKNPLVGLNDDTFGGPRFPAMSDAYDEALRQLTWDVAGELGIRDVVRREGTYVQCSGPNYETGAESYMWSHLGGSAVGMSTVPEVTVARHCGMRVLGLSMITNKAIMPGDDGPVATHKEVLETVEIRAKDIQNLVHNVVMRLGTDDFAKEEPKLLKEVADFKKNRKGYFYNIEDRIKSLDLANMTQLDAMVELQALKNMVTNN